MKEVLIQFANSVFWDPEADDKIYLDGALIAIDGFPFHMRQVRLRFRDGPELDLSIWDMDQLAIEYLKLRGMELPKVVTDLTSAKPPCTGDFVVPASLMSEMSNGMGAKSDNLPSAEAGLKNSEARRCARCNGECAELGDSNEDFCPQCANKTEGN